MKASALGCPSRFPVASFPMMKIMETDEREICRQPASSPSPHVVDVKCQPTHCYIIYLFFFHIKAIESGEPTARWRENFTWQLRL